MNSRTPLLAALTFLGWAAVAPPQAQAYINSRWSHPGGQTYFLAGFLSRDDQGRFEDYGQKVERELGPYNAAVQRDPGDPVAYYQRARAWEQLPPYSGPWPFNRPDDRWDTPMRALHEYNKAISIDPSFTRAYWRRASLQLSLGRTEQGLEDLRQVIRLEPRSALAEKARALLREHDEEEPNASATTDGKGAGISPGSKRPPEPAR